MNSVMKHSTYMGGGRVRNFVGNNGSGQNFARSIQEKLDVNNSELLIQNISDIYDTPEIVDLPKF